MSHPIINFAIRGAQFVFGVIILGLTVDLIRQHHVGDLPATLGFAAFVAAITIVGSFIGIASNFVEALQGIVGAGIDFVIALINLAGGALIAYKLRRVNCGNKDSEDNIDKLFRIDILNGGCVKQGCWYESQENIGFNRKIFSRCKESQADEAFMFIIAILLLASAGLQFLKKRY